MRLAREGDVPIYGLNYKNDRVGSQDWLERYDNPYRASAYDGDGDFVLYWPRMTIRTYLL